MKEEGIPFYGWFSDDTVIELKPKHDPVNHPKHYTSHPSGVECIQITRHMGYNLGNVIKYVWRADLKGKDVEDLEKAVFYLQDEIKLRKGNRDANNN